MVQEEQYTETDCMKGIMVQIMDPKGQSRLTKRTIFIGMLNMVSSMSDIARLTINIFEMPVPVVIVGIEYEDCFGVNSTRHTKLLPTRDMMTRIE